jgi:hypothetical protein
MVMNRNDRAWLRSAACLLLAATMTAVAADKPCSTADAANAEKAIDRVVSWQALQKAVRDYGHCDTGTAAEYFTEALLRLLVGSWQKLDQADMVLDSDPAFRAWVLKRLSNPGLPKDDIDAVHNLSQGSCPIGRGKLCEAIHDAIEVAKGGGAAKAPAAPAAPGPATAPEPQKGKP